MSQDWQQDVATFMREVKGLEVPRSPVTNQAPLIRGLCKALMQEELAELCQAIDEQNLVETADGIADLIYVALYTACSYGINMAPIWDEVQASNMTKKGGPKREDGKQLKGPEFRPPNLAPILEEQLNDS